ncbi:unnamed protein product [Closterium sp. Naga37s-1]|nr:unnamed protein product [Closterium sp. Naga37s-1]
MLSRLISHSFPFPIPSPRLSPHSRQPANFTSDIFNRQLPDAITTALKQPWKKQVSRTDWSADVDECRPIPVVVVHQQPSGSVACRPSHFMHRNLRHTRQRNAVVYFIGPDSDECVEMARELDIVLDPVIGYQDVVGWFSANLGDPVSYQVRWFILKAFMERHAFPRIFFLDSDVILFANITELATMLFSRVHLVVSQRWPRYEWVRRYGCIVWVRRFVGVRGGGYGAGCMAIFFLDSDVILFANVTEVATRLFSRVHLVVSQRWPSMGVDVSVPLRQRHRPRHQALLVSSSGGVAALAQVWVGWDTARLTLRTVPPGTPHANVEGPSQYASTAVSGHVSLWTYDALSDCPSQYASTAVSGHVSLWTYDALSDFLDFFQLFVQEATLYGQPGDARLVAERAYNDMVVLGWYTHRICWMKNPQNLHPQCICDKESGVTPERSARIRGKFTPKFRVDSFATPRWCNATDWWDEGWCVFDNNFSIQTPTQFFKYRPQDGMKCPSSMHYTHFDDWAKEGEKQTSPVQFLGVHFQAHRKGYLTRGDDPAATWGSSPD